MTHTRTPIRWCSLAAVAALAFNAAESQDVHRVTSPDGRNVVEVGIREGHLYYAVQRAGRNIIMPSLLGFEFRNQPSLRDSGQLAIAVTHAPSRAGRKLWRTQADSRTISAMPSPGRRTAFTRRDGSGRAAVPTPA